MQNQDINDLFAAARNSEVKISLDDVRTTLSKDTTKAYVMNWKAVFFSIIGGLLLAFFMLFPTKEENTQLSILDSSNSTTTMTPVTTKSVALTKKAPDTTTQAVEQSKDKNLVSTVTYEDQKTSPKLPAVQKTPVSTNFQKKERDLINLHSIFFEGRLNQEANEKEVISNLSLEDFPKDVAPIFEVPNVESHPLQDYMLEGGKGEIHYMETLKSKETISLKSYKKGGKKHLKLDRYNKNFEIIRSIDLSAIIQKNKRKLNHVKMFNDQLLLVTSEVSSKDKSRLYTGHTIDYNNMQEKGSTPLGNFSLAKTKKGLNVQVSSNGKYLLLNLKPETEKDQKKISQKGINEPINFHVYQENLKPFYTIKKHNFLAYETAIGDAGETYVWKTQPKFLATSRSILALKNGHVLYQFNANKNDSLILKENSFLNTVSAGDATLSTTYNRRLIELKGLELTLSPQGNPILYGYLKNMRGLQQLTFTTESLNPHHYSVLDFQTKEALATEVAREEGKPDVILKVDEVFFDDESNFYVLSSSYKRHFLPLAAQENEAKNSDFSERIPVPYYPSLDIYVHKFNEVGTPIMNTKIASTVVSRNEESSNYSYLFNDHNFSVVYLDHIVSDDPEYVPTLGNEQKKNPQQKEELIIAAAKQDGEIVRFKADQENDATLENYKPVKYFRNKGETLVLLKAGNSYKISKLSYRNMLEKTK